LVYSIDGESLHEVLKDFPGPSTARILDLQKRWKLRRAFVRFAQSLCLHAGVKFYGRVSMTFIETRSAVPWQPPPPLMPYMDQVAAKYGSTLPGKMSGTSELQLRNTQGAAAAYGAIMLTKKHHRDTRHSHVQHSRVTRQSYEHVQHERDERDARQEAMLAKMQADIETLTDAMAALVGRGSQLDA